MRTVRPVKPTAGLALYDSSGKLRSSPGAGQRLRTPIRHPLSRSL